MSSPPAPEHPVPIPDLSARSICPGPLRVPLRPTRSTNSQGRDGTGREKRSPAVAPGQRSFPANSATWLIGRIVGGLPRPLRKRSQPHRSPRTPKPSRHQPRPRSTSRSELRGSNALQQSAGTGSALGRPSHDARPAECRELLRPTYNACRVSAAERVADGRADLLHRRFVDLAHSSSERRLRNRVQPVAVDHRFPIDARRRIVQIDLCGETSSCRGDLCDRDQSPNVEYLGPSQHEHGASFPAYLCEPDVPAIHSSPQVSVSSQNESTLSGFLSYASRSRSASAARTADATPFLAAEEMFTPRRRACSASVSSRVNVDRVVVIALDASTTCCISNDDVRRPMRECRCARSLDPDERAPFASVPLWCHWQESRRVCREVLRLSARLRGMSFDLGERTSRRRFCRSETRTQRPSWLHGHQGRIPSPPCFPDGVASSPRTGRPPTSTCISVGANHVFHRALTGSPVSNASIRLLANSSSLSIDPT